MPEPLITIFIRAPRLGTVKTRLAESLGDKAALDAYQQLTETVLTQLETFPRVDLRFTPDDSFQEISRWLRPNWTATPQGSGDLGERMSRVFQNVTTPTLLIGSDCPYLTTQDLREATLALANHDLALGPACDGGYWLIGMNQPYPALFRDIAWSTDKVYQSTLHRAEALKLRTWQGRRLSDIDSPDDWSRYQRGQ